MLFYSDVVHAKWRHFAPETALDISKKIQLLPGDSKTMHSKTEAPGEQNKAKLSKMDNRIHAQA